MENIKNIVFPNPKLGMVLVDNISDVTLNTGTSVTYATGNNEQTYTHSKVITMLEHLLSFQKQGNQWSTSNSLDVDTMLKELKKLGFHVNPNGKNMETGV